MNFNNYLLIFISGGLRSLSRFLIGQKLVSAQLFAYSLPIATLSVNAIGSLLAGLLIGFFGREHNLTPYVLGGFLGGFTTFSAFSIEVIVALKDSQFILAFIIVFLNVFLAILLCYSGYSLSRQFIS